MIDILLSTYNGEKYLSEQIDSILNQTYSDWKILIRDDGSADKTLLIIDKYCHKYTNKIINISDNLGNLGVIRSNEILLEQSLSNYFMFCDQDDVWLPNKIANSFIKMKNIEAENFDCPIIIFSDLIVVNEDLQIISKSFWKYCKISIKHLRKAKYLAVNNYVAGCTMLFNKNAKLLTLPFGKNATMHDAWIVLKVSASGGIITSLPQAEILYRQHGKNQLGAGEIKYNFKYFMEKITNLNFFLKNNYSNYKQAHEILNTSLFTFFIRRIIYVLKR